MGNQIVCPSGSDWYRRDLTLRNYQILCSLFDGTFSLSFKAENVYNHKLKVIKVFWIDSPQTGKIVDMFNKTFDKMLKIPAYQIFGNLFSEPYVTKNGAYLIRPYLEQPLIERITDSPPLHYWEKKWIAFQLLQAVKNLGEQGFWHGDIKPENVIVGSSLRVSLVDHAPFKPSMIGTNQPHYFIHFFSYMRSCCFLAPERITNTNKYINFFAADIFSVACVIAYMYLNGQYLFNYSTIQLLRDDSEIPLLSYIDDQNIRNLVRSLLLVDHRARLRNFHNFESFFPPWFSEFYRRFRFALNDGSPNAIIYNFNREFLNSILTSSNSKSKKRRKSTSCLELNPRSYRSFDVDMNSHLSTFSVENMKTSSIMKDVSENNSNLILETTPDLSSVSEISQSSNSNSDLQPISSLELKHHFNSQIIQNSILELKQNDNSTAIKVNKKNSTPILKSKKTFEFNSLPIRHLKKPSAITFLKQDDPLIICIPLITGTFFTSKISTSDICHLIRLFVHLSIRLKDPILKLTRCIPHLIGLFGHNNTTINVIAINGLINIISSINFYSFKIRLFESNRSNDSENFDIINLMPDYPSNYLIPHLFSSIKGSWSQQFFARLPFLIVHISRLWPSFLNDVHTKRQFIKNFVGDPLVMRPFIRSAAQISVFFYNFQQNIKNYKNKVSRRTTVYPLFVCFSKYMKSLMNLSLYNSELTHFYSMYIVNFQQTDLFKFVKYDLYDLVLKMSQLILNTNKSSSNINIINLSKGSILNKMNKNYSDENNTSILLFFYELLLFLKNNIPLPVLSIIANTAVKFQFASDCRLRTISKQILKVLPDSLSFIKFGNIQPRNRLRKNTYHSSKNIGLLLNNEKNTNQEKSVKNNFKITNNQSKPLFLYSQKLFEGEVKSIFLHPPSSQTTFFHSKSILSLFDIDENQIIKFDEIKATNFHENIDFLTQISDHEILLTSGSKVYITSNVQLKATIKLSNELTFLTSFYNNRLLSTSKNSPSTIAIRNLNRMISIESRIKLNDSIPTCIQTFENQPFFAFGTNNNNFVYTVDSRIGMPVYGINTNECNFNKILTFSYSKSYQFAVVGDDVIEFFDPRYILNSNKNSPYFRVSGKIEFAENYRSGVMVLGSNGTFYLDPNDSKSVISLFDNEDVSQLKSLDDSEFNFKLPSNYQKSLHNHLFTVSSLNYNKSSGLCCTGDKCGFVNMWLPYI